MPPVLEFSQTRLRYLIVAALISSLFVYFLSTSDTIREHTNSLSNSIHSSLSGERLTDDELTESISRHIEYFPLDKAEQWCKNYRYDVWQGRDKPRKIYDLMMVNKELDWLEIRMGQMYDDVDYFVVMEAATTFTDQPKELSVKNNWHRFAPYHDKIIRHTLEDSPVPLNTTWDREGFSRNAMYNQVIPRLTGPQKAELGDIIIVSDVDEIPRPEALKTMRNCEIPQHITLRSRMYYYSFQWSNRIDDWPHPQATIYKGADTTEPQELRAKDDNIEMLYHAAWHCSYCFSTLEETIDKVMSFSHAELNQPRFRDASEILRRIRTGLDFFEREDSILDRVEDNEDIPDFLRANREKYAFALDRDPESANFRDYDRAKYGGIGT